MNISKNDFTILDFLARNFYQKLTVRNIAQKLKISPAGAHLSLRKFEKYGVVICEKLGTGLFYSINFENKSAQYLAAIALTQGKSEEIDAKIAVLNNKNLLLIGSDLISYKDYKLQKETEESFVDNLRGKGNVVEFLQKGQVIKGELELINIIKKLMVRF